MFHVPEEYRVTAGPLASSQEKDGNNGAFSLQYTDRGPVKRKIKLLCIASDGGGWEHVSVRAVEVGLQRLPTWNEMVNIKKTFWDADDCVVQFHPPEKDYVNNHPYVLHLWRKIGGEFPMPQNWMGGIPGLNFEI